jgi:hypothetical protein
LLGLGPGPFVLGPDEAALDPNHAVIIEGHESPAARDVIRIVGLPLCRMWIGPGQPSVDNSCSTTNTMRTKHQYMDLITDASAGPAEWSQQRRSNILDAI